MSSKSDIKYTLTISPEHAQLLVRALDLFSRIGMGQFEKISSVYRTLTIDQKTNLYNKLLEIKEIVGLPYNDHHGIHSPDIKDDFRQAFDMLQVIRHRLAWDKNPKGGFQVYFDTPEQIGLLTLPSIKCQNEK